jgi:hypothetical protein
LQEVNGRFFLSIPKEYVKWKKWIKGEELVIDFNEREFGDLRSKEKEGVRGRDHGGVSTVTFCGWTTLDSTVTGGSLA